jgi:hypothetical protein
MAIIKEVLFNDGEGIDHTDFNDLQRFLRSQFLDMGMAQIGRGSDGLLGGAIGSISNYPGVLGDHCAPSVASGMTIDVAAGMLMQSTMPGGVPSGDDALVLSFWVGNGVLDTVHAAADPTNPRWDLVSIELSYADGDTESRDFQDASTLALSTTTPNKRRNVVCTKTVTQGTPAATPTIPATPSGDVPLYAVYIPAAAVTLLNANIFDYRLPAGRFVVDCYAYDAYNKGRRSGTFVAPITGTAFGYIEASVASSDLLFIPEGFVANNARLVAVHAVSGDTTGLSTYTLRRFNALNYGNLAGSVAHNTLPLVAMEALTGLESTETTTLNGGLIATRSGPIWINGFGAGYANQPENLSAPNEFSRLGVHWEAGGNNDRISMVRMFFAGGL